MSIETIVNDVKSRADVVVSRGQEAVEIGVETLKAANTIVVEGVQALVETNVAAGKELASLVQASLDKAKTDGLKAVAGNPVAYLPEGKSTVINAYSESVKVVSKTGDELAKTLKSGVENIAARIQGEKLVAKAKKTVRKTAKKASAKTRKLAKAVAE